MDFTNNSVLGVEGVTRSKVGGLRSWKRRQYRFNAVLGALALLAVGFLALHSRDRVTSGLSVRALDATPTPFDWLIQSHHKVGSICIVF
jgi:hypothetical protein